MGGLGYSQAKSKSSQESGLRGTPYESRSQDQAYRAGTNLAQFSQSAQQDPRYLMNIGRQMLPGGKYGLGENVDQGVEALGDYSFSQASKSGAMRGQNSPQNTQAVVGSAIQNMLPFLIPQLQQQQQSQFTAPMGLFDIAAKNADYWGRVLGSQGSSSSSSFGFQANVGGAAKPFQSA